MLSSNTLQYSELPASKWCYLLFLSSLYYIYFFYFTLLIQVNLIDKQDLIIKSNQMYQICTNQDLIAECACFNFTKTFFHFLCSFLCTVVLSGVVTQNICNTFICVDFTVFFFKNSFQTEIAGAGLVACACAGLVL